MPSWLKLEPALIGSAVAAAYAAVAMLYRAFVDHSGVFEPDVLVAALGALYGLFVRSNVTPLARPRSRAKHPLHGPVANGENTPA